MTGPEALLLVALMRDPALGQRTAKEVKDAAGIRDAVAYRAARAGLERMGAINVTHIPGKPAQLSLSLAFLFDYFDAALALAASQTQPNQSGTVKLIVKCSTGAEASEPDAADEVVPGAKLTKAVFSEPGGYWSNPQGLTEGVGQTHTVQPTGLVKPTGSDLQGGSNLQGLTDRVRAVDAMPGDGDEQRVSSNFQVRRRAQIPLMQEVWAEWFPKQPLTIPNAKMFLRLSSESVEQFSLVLQQLENRPAYTDGNLRDGSGAIAYVKTMFTEPATGGSIRAQRATAPETKPPWWTNEKPLQAVEPPDEDMAEVEARVEAQMAEKRRRFREQVANSDGGPGGQEPGGRSEGEGKKSA